MESPDGKWSPERFALAARHFGQFNGSFLADRPVPTHAWLGRNLLRAVASETVVLDWEDVAIAAVGEEVAALTILAPALREIPLHDAEPFDQLVFDQYMAGLADVGWHGDAATVRLGYTTACLRYGLALPAMFIDLALDESRHAALEERDGQTVTEFADHWAEVQRFIFRRIDEARRLIGG